MFLGFCCHVFLVFKFVVFSQAARKPYERHGGRTHLCVSVFLFLGIFGGFVWNCVRLYTARKPYHSCGFRPPTPRMHVRQQIFLAHFHHNSNTGSCKYCRAFTHGYQHMRSWRIRMFQMNKTFSSRTVSSREARFDRIYQRRPSMYVHCARWIANHIAL